jgi:hypothetical protein
MTPSMRRAGGSGLFMVQEVGVTAAAMSIIAAELRYDHC